MEIRAVSTQLTLRYDGKVVLEKTDARLDRGLPTIYAEKDGWIRKIEVLNLDATSIPATLLTQYTAALTRARDAANTSPADKAACQAELARLKTSPSIPAGDAPDIPAALKNLRNVVRKELEKLPPPAAR